MQAFDKYGAEDGIEHATYRPLNYWPFSIFKFVMYT